MVVVEELARHFGRRGVESTFRVGERTYHLFAYPSPSNKGSVRWNLYEVRSADNQPLQGLSFGIAGGVHEALEAVLSAARRHASGEQARAASTFRPSPFD